MIEPISHSSPALAYATRPRRFNRRRQRQALVLAVVLLASFIAYKQWDLGLRLRWNMLHAQRRCMNFTTKPGVVADDSLTDAALGAYADAASALAKYESARDPKAPQLPFNIYLPPAWYGKVEEYRPECVFVHELQSPSGHRRLVIVRVCRLIDDGLIDVDADVVVPGTWRNPPRLISTQPSAQAYLFHRPGALSLRGMSFPPNDATFFFGQRDLRDPGRFVITSNYFRNIQGRLLDDDRVEMRVLPPPAVWRPATPSTWPVTVPTTVPSSAPAWAPAAR